MLDFIDSTGKFFTRTVFLLDNHMISIDLAHKVFKVDINLGIVHHTWEFSGHLPAMAKFYKLIDRRDGTF